MTWKKSIICRYLAYRHLDRYIVKLFTKLDCVRCHDFIVYSFQGSRDTGKISRKRSSRALTSRILRSRECCTAENIQWQQRKKAWSTAPPLPRASLQISFSPAQQLPLCIALLVVVFIFYKCRLKCPQGEHEESGRLSLIHI